MAAQHADDSDTEVSEAFSQQLPGSTGLYQPNASMKPSNAAAQYVIEMGERSDDEESDHGGAEPYASHMRGRVSPSPYTANTDRARQFNAYVRGVIEQKLDVLVPISHQPRDLVSEIIADASSRFPEFASCSRKRIRTFLKSYRRSKKIKDVTGTFSVSPATNGVGKGEEVGLSVLAGTGLSHLAQCETPPPPAQQTGSAVVTIVTDNSPHGDEDPLPEPKRLRLQSPTKAVLPGLSGSSHPPSLSSMEEQAVRQLITGYRESAAFLQRAADQLETMLHNNAA